MIHLEIYQFCSLNLPIIFILCHIAHLIECVTMFYLTKRLHDFNIDTKPCTDYVSQFGTWLRYTPI